MSHEDEIPTVISRPLPNAVTYDLSRPAHVTITLPSGSTWSSGLHWHETHTEYLRVVRGAIRVRLGGQERTLAATPPHSHPEVRVDRHVWHEWRRADPTGSDDVVVVERTEPADGEKALFFWNLNGVILAAGRMGSGRQGIMGFVYLPARLRGLLLDLWISLNLFVIFYHLDNVPVLLDLSSVVGRVGVAAEDGSVPANTLGRVERVYSHLVLFIASWLGSWLGVQPVRREFTPKTAYQQWWASKSKTA